MTGLTDIGPGGERTVVCIACGDTVPRSEAREYDRYGDRWTREDKRFEHLCRPCDSERCRRPRDGLEAALIEAGAGETDRETFLRAFLDADGRETGPESRE